MNFDDRAYLTPPDNEAIPVLKCGFCGDFVCEGEAYYSLNWAYICEKCMDEHFKQIAELPDLEAEKADLEYPDGRR